MKKDSRIEMLRIIACVFVIIIHIMRPDIINDEVNNWHLFLHTVVGDAVSVFFAITGCFIYRSNSMRWRYKGINYLINILLPTVLAGIGITMLMPVLDSKMLFAGFRLDKPDCWNFMKGLLFFQPGLWSSPCSIYWYVFEYVKILIFYPVCYLISKNKNTEKIVIGLCVASVLIGDINHFFKMSIFGNITLLPASVSFSLMGDYLYSQHSNDGKNRMGILILGLIAIIVVRFILQRWAYISVGSGENLLVYWNHIFAFLIVYFVFRIVLCFNQDTFNTKFVRIIGENSFYIYLLHIVFVWRLKRIDGLYDRIANGAGALYCLQMFAIAIVILLITLVIAVPVRAFHRKCVEPLFRRT